MRRARRRGWADVTRHSLRRRPVVRATPGRVRQPPGGVELDRRRRPAFRDRSGDQLAVVGRAPRCVSGKELQTSGGSISTPATAGRTRRSMRRSRAIDRAEAGPADDRLPRPSRLEQRSTASSRVLLDSRPPVALRARSRRPSRGGRRRWRGALRCQISAASGSQMAEAAAVRGCRATVGPSPRESRHATGMPPTSSCSAGGRPASAASPPSPGTTSPPGPRSSWRGAVRRSAASACRGSTLRG